ncbi:alpha-mannosidase 2x-like [Littorina saxatilis]|uniref:Alpha-mannosidase n=1 Tax=Littorina saxatilis TaxID=31220 RepID=A0AAN9BGW1_9CAEN
MAHFLSLLARMKFWQRFLILGSSFFLMGTLYYYTLLDASLDPNLHEHRRALESRLGASSFRSIFKSFSMHLDPAVCAMHPGGGGAGGGGISKPHPYSNISTLDVFHEAHFNILADGMYELPSPPPEFPRLKKADNGAGGKEPLEKDQKAEQEEEEELEPLNVIIMPHSHVDPGWQKTTNEYYTDQTKHIFINMVNKLTEYPDLAFVWAETIYFAMWWNELEDAVKVHVRRLIRRGQLEIAMGGWVMPDEASSHYVSVIDQLVEGHQWLWENLRVKPQNSWSIDPFGYSGTMPYIWKLAGMDNMVIQRVHQAVKASLMTEESMEFHWRQFWDAKGTTDILCHVMPYMLYSIKFTCGPNRFICLLYDFRSIPGEPSESRAKSITDANVEQFSEYLYKQFRQKSYFYKYNTILVPLGDDFRYDQEVEWDQQHGNYSRLMKYMNGRKDWKINVKFGTLKDYFKLTRQEQLGKKYAGKDTDFPLLSGDFFPYSDRNMEYWTGYYTTRPFDKRFQREVQGMIQAADIAVTLTYALYKRWGLEVQEKFFHLASMMQSAHRGQGQFLHHDAITGTSKDFVVIDFESQLLAAYSATQSVMKMALQALITKGKVETPYVFKPETVRKAYDMPPKKVKLAVHEGGLKVFVYNPLPQYRQQPVHLLVDTNKFFIKNHLREIIPCQINPVWQEDEATGVESNVYEIVFVADLPPLATLPFMIFRDTSLTKTSYPAKLSVFNSETLVVPPQTLFSQEQPEPARTQPVAIQNDKVRIHVDPKTGRLIDLEERATGNVTVLNMLLEVYRSQGSGAYIFHPKSGSEPLISNIPVIRVVEGPVVSQLTVVYEPYITQTFTLYHHPALLSSALHVRNDLNILTLRDREVIMRMKTDLKIKKPEFFSDQNGMQFIRRRTNDNVGLEANYYPLTSGAFIDDGERRVSLLTAQPHGVASLDSGWLELMLDRHLLYDDGRGMEEGVTDIKPVTSEFMLMVERRPDGHQRPQADYKTGAHNAFPSLLSLSLSDRLQQPPQVFYSEIDSDIFFGFLQPMKVALPCDVALLSLRSLATGNLNYNGTSLILHRRAYDCDFTASDMQCAASGKSVTFSALFKEFGLGVQTVKETSLTHLHHKQTLPIGANLDLQPMQIASYHITF